MNYKITIPPKTTIRFVRQVITTKKETIKSVPVNVYVGLKIFKLRQEAELTQVELAKKLGLDRVSIVNLEKGRQSLTIINMEKICKIFKVKSNQIIPF